MRLTVNYGCLHADASTRCVQLQQDAVLRPYNLQLPNTMSELRGQPPPAPTAVPLRQLLRVPLSLPPLFLRGERHFHGCFTCSRHVGCHFAARECRSLHNSRGPPLIGCLPYASVSSGFQWGHLDTSPGASLRSFSVDPGSTLPIPTPHLKSMCKYTCMYNVPVLVHVHVLNLLLHVVHLTCSM